MRPNSPNSRHEWVVCACGAFVGRQRDHVQVGRSKGSRRYLATAFCLCPPKCDAHSDAVTKRRERVVAATTSRMRRKTCPDRHWHWQQHAAQPLAQQLAPVQLLLVVAVLLHPLKPLLASTCQPLAPLMMMPHRLPRPPCRHC